MNLLYDGTKLGEGGREGNVVTSGLHNYKAF